MSIIPGLFGRKASKTNALEPVSLEIWDPFDGFSFTDTTLSTTGFATACMDWKETPEAHVFTVELPGLKKDEVKIEVEEEKILKISGQRTKEREKNEKWHWIERSSDRFLRSVRLPPNAGVDRVKAVLENGVLTVTVPKEQEKVHGVDLFRLQVESFQCC